MPLESWTFEAGWGATPSLDSTAVEIQIYLESVGFSTHSGQVAGRPAAWVGGLVRTGDTISEAMVSAGLAAIANMGVTG